MVKRNTRITAPKGSQASPEDRLKGFRKRLLLVGLVLVALYGVGAYRAFSLQVIDRDAMLKEGERNYLRTMIVETRRGDILDRNGETLATSVRVDTIVANPREVRNPVETARSLAGVLEGINENDLLRKLKSKRWWEYVKRRVSQEESDRVRALKLDGVLITQEWKRFYPKGEMLGQVLGRVGMDAKGLDGLERGMDSLLFPREESAEKKKGKAGLRVPYIKDIRGKKAYMEGLPGDLSPEGESLELTIDANIQDVADKALAAGVEKHGGHTGIAMVMDVESGELLAVSNYPFFDPNNPGNTEMYLWKNRAFKDQFEPGSTLKVFSLAAVLEQGMTRLDEVIDVENGRMKVGRYWIRDTHKAEELTTRDVLAQSSNVGITKLAQRIEKESLMDILVRFGFGKQTGIESDYEVKGKIQPLSKWADITYANIAFGQGIAVSAIQLLNAFAAVGNDGVMLRPRLVRRVVSEDGTEVVPSEPIPVGRVLSKPVNEQVIRAMEAVTQEGGTATTAAIRGYGVAGKTGTAQKPATGYRRGKKVEEPKGGYAEDAWISSFVGLVPSEDPKLAILILVDEPEGRGFGGVVAAPIFKEIAAWTLQYLGIRSSEKRPLKTSSRSNPGLKPLSPMQDSLAMRPVSAVAPEVPVDGMAAPDLLGKSMATVVRKAREAGVELIIRGTGRSVRQQPAPGRPLSGTRQMTVEFKSPSPPTAAIQGGAHAAP